MSKMNNAPIYYALSQVQYNPIAAMSKYADDIQDILRHQGYTLFEQQHVNRLEFSVGPGQPQENPEIKQTTNWLISRADKGSGFILGPSSLTYHTTHYEANTEFIPAIIQGIRAVNEVVGLEHISRIGLRYLDAVIPSPGKMVDDYLVGGLQGVQLEAKRRYSMSESVFDTELNATINQGTLISRIYRLTSQLGYPPDLSPQGLQPMQRFMITNAISHAVIDTDHFVEGRLSVDLNQVSELFSLLHAGIRQVFEATTTDFAKAEWS